MAGSDRCRAHSEDPVVQASLAAARAKGGANRKRPPRRLAKANAISSVPEVLAVLRDLLDEVLGMEPGQARTKQATEILGKALEAQRLARELNAPEAVKQLEEMLAKIERARRDPTQRLAVVKGNADADGT